MNEKKEELSDEMLKDISGGVSGNIQMVATNTGNTLIFAQVGNKVQSIPENTDGAPPRATSNNPGMIFA